MGKLGIIEYLCVQFSDKRAYRIPAMLIARCRAHYYAELDSEKHGEDFQEVFEAEVKYALGDSFELEDWAQNNMNWSDVQSVAARMPTEESDIDRDREWTNAYTWVEYEQPAEAE